MVLLGTGHTFRAPLLIIRSSSPHAPELGTFWGEGGKIARGGNDEPLKEGTKAASDAGSSVH